MSGGSRYQEDLRIVSEQIRQQVDGDPMVGIVAIMDELVDVACGTSPHLKDYMRLQIYRRILQRIASATDRVARTCQGCDEVVASKELLDATMLCHGCRSERRATSDRARIEP